MGPQLSAATFHVGLDLVSAETDVFPNAHATPFLLTVMVSRDWDGRQLIKVEHEFKIDWFRGTKKMTELSEVPLEMYDGAEELKEMIRERSRKL